jgi:hypothetical protein
MTAEQNKKLVYQFFDCMNNKDWVQLEKLVHDDFGEDGTPEDRMRELNAQTVEEADKIRTEINPFFKFLKLIGMSEETIMQAIKVLGIKNNIKQGFIQQMKFMNDMMSNWEIIDIIADEERVWCMNDTVFNDPNQRGITINSHTKIKIKDNQIIDFSGFSRFYATLIQFGNIVMKRNQKEEVQHYIQVLKEMGIIPPQVLQRPPN